MFFIPYGTREHTQKRRFPFITLLLVLINIAVFTVQASVLATYGEAGLNAFFERYAIIPSDLFDGTPLEIGLLTAMFLHGDLLHILSNIIFLLPFGDNVEDRLGHFRYLIFYLASGLIATIAYALFNAGSSVPLVGASGAIAGVLAGYIALHPKGIVKGFFVFIIIPFKVYLPAFIFIGYWFILQVFSSIQTLGPAEMNESGGVAFLAHVGGFLGGLLLTPLLIKKTQPIHPYR